MCNKTTIGWYQSLYTCETTKTSAAAFENLDHVRFQDKDFGAIGISLPQFDVYTVEANS